MITSTYTVHSISFSTKKKKKITILRTSKITVFHTVNSTIDQELFPRCGFSSLKFFREITVRNPLVHLLLFLCSTIKGTRGEKKRERERIPLPSSNTDTLRFRFSRFGLNSDGPLLRLNFKLWKEGKKLRAHLTDSFLSRGNDGVLEIISLEIGHI